MDLVRIPIRVAMAHNKEHNQMNPNYVPIDNDDRAFRGIIAMVFIAVSYLSIALITIMFGACFENMDEPKKQK